MIPNYEHDQHSTFWSLASLAFSEARNANLVPPLPSPQHRVSLPPDEQLLCFDFLYYVAAQEVRIHVLISSVAHLGNSPMKSA
jgi:hypothetical protein